MVTPMNLPVYPSGTNLIGQIPYFIIGHRSCECQKERLLVCFFMNSTLIHLDMIISFKERI